MAKLFISHSTDDDAQEGEQRGLRQAVEALCDVLGIELTTARRDELATLDAAKLTMLLARLRERRRWT